MKKKDIFLEIFKGVSKRGHGIFHSKADGDSKYK
jgi:hypothetical protein